VRPQEERPPPARRRRDGLPPDASNTDARLA